MKAGLFFAALGAWIWTGAVIGGKFRAIHDRIDVMQTDINQLNAELMALDYNAQRRTNPPRSLEEYRI